MDYSFDTAPEDPWVRISDCIKNLFSPIMSENHGHVPLQPSTSLGEEDGTQGHPEGVLSKPDTVNGAPRVYRAADGSTVKKGPPVAPKPAWFRQSLKGLRNRVPDPRRLPEAASATQLTPASRDPPGPHSQASSIRQKISSFENFGSSQLPDRGVQRLSVQPSSGDTTKLPGKQDAGRFSGVLGQGASVSAKHRQAEPDPIPKALPNTSEVRDPGVSESPPPGQRPIPKALTPDPLLRRLTTQTEDTQGPGLKLPSQRARSFPLTRTQSCETRLLDEKASKIYSISSQLSSAVMKSLLCLPSSVSCGQITCTPKEKVSPKPPCDNSTPAEGLGEAMASDTGFSLK